MSSPEPLLEGTPLAEIFERAQSLFNGSLEQEGPRAEASMSECLSLLEECARRVRQLSLFSSNEELDDVATSILKYLLVPYMCADVTHRKPFVDRIEADTGAYGSDSRVSENEASTSRLPFAVLSPDETANLRLQTLRRTLQFLEEFLISCERLELVSKEEKLSLLGSLDPAAPLDAATKRAVKVARFKKEKELRQRLEMLKARKAAATRMKLRRGTEARGKANDNGTGGRDTGDEAASSEDSFLDEAEERKLWIAELQMAWVKALDLEQSVKREQEMLTAARKASHGDGLRAVAQEPLTREQLDRNLKEREASHRRAAAAAAMEIQAGISASPAAITCATLAQDVIEGRAGPDQVSSHKHTPMPFAFGPVSLMNGANSAARGNLGSLTALDARQMAAARVFQPSHSLPTMSIEEAGLREMNMMNDWTERVREEMEEQGLQVKEKGGPADFGNGTPDGEEEEDEDEKESDAAVMKARYWDDWKDENPRGKGNSKLTPCG